MIQRPVGCAYTLSLLIFSMIFHNDMGHPLTFPLKKTVLFTFRCSLVRPSSRKSAITLERRAAWRDRDDPVLGHVRSWEMGESISNMSYRRRQGSHMGMEGLTSGGGVARRRGRG